MTDRNRDVAVDPPRDAELARALREVEGPPPSEARLEILRLRIAAAARAALGNHHERPWWEWTARWARAEVALSIAACVVAIVAATTARAPAEHSSDTVEIAAIGASILVEADSIVTRAVATGASADQVMTALVGPSNDAEWLLAAAVARPSGRAP